MTFAGLADPEKVAKRVTCPVSRTKISPQSHDGVSNLCCLSKKMLVPGLVDERGQHGITEAAQKILQHL